MPADAHALLDATRAVLAAIDDGKPVPFAGMNRAAASATDDEKNAAIKALVADAPGLAMNAPLKAALRSIASGSIVEAGGDASEGADALVDVVATIARDLVPIVQADNDIALDEPKPDSAPPVRAWPLAVVGAMARLARSVDLRKRFRARTDDAKNIRAILDATGGAHAHFLASILDMLDDAPLYLVDVTSSAPRVKKLRAFGIRNGFHLITLLEGRDPKALVRAGSTSISSAYGWFTWPALEQHGARFVAKHAGNTLWGEMVAADLHQFEGVRVAVKAPPILASRSWSIGFVSPIHEALDEKLVDEGSLSAADARDLVTRMATAK